MKLLLTLSFIFLVSCTKNILTGNPVSIEEFKAMIEGKHFQVSAYYNHDGPLPYPVNTLDDVFAFNSVLGEISSLEPCRITYVPLRIYQEGTAVKMDWLNLNVSYETFKVKEVNSDYFVLEGSEHSIKYSVTR